MSTQEDRIVLLFGGDFVPPHTDEVIYSDELLKVLRSKDFSIINLESPLTQCIDPISKTGNNFKRSSEDIRHIKEGFFDAVALSNNHIRDFGDIGVLDTLAVCKNNNIKTVGAGINKFEAGRHLNVDVKGKRLAFLNFSEHEFNIASANRGGANLYDTISAYYDIQKAKQECDFVFVIYHGGIEYCYYPTQETIREFKFLIDSGADSVIAHHTHYYSGVLEYKNKPIFFGLGNFFIDYINVKNPPSGANIGLIIKLEIYNGLVNFSLIPIMQSYNDKRLDLPPEYFKDQILDNINGISTTIKDFTKFKRTWELYAEANRNKTLSLILSSNKLEFLLRKRIGLLNRNTTRFKKLTSLNLFRCASLRQKAILILENCFKE